MNAIFGAYLFIFGLIFGSFASVLIFRWQSKKKGIISGRSECPNCGHTLTTLDLVPFFSYVFLKGKCRHCGSKIGIIYPLLELSMGILFLLTGIFLVDSSLIFSFNLIEISKLILLLFVSFVIITFTFYDILYFEIPDEIVIPSLYIIFVLLLISSLTKDFNIFNYFSPFTDNILNIPLINGVIGASLIFSFFLFQILVSKGAWMGGGDLRIAVFMGLVGGTKIALLGLLIAYFLGSIFGIIILIKTRNRENKIPFGPYLGMGLFISLMFHTQIINWYFSIL
ncbi:prepilin peptidase [Candidatus Gracilibacteria bacterium]|nr:prepilin peptidase [Candidatus Gracilibacteria bacterium]